MSADMLLRPSSTFLHFDSESERNYRAASQHTEFRAIFEKCFVENLSEKRKQSMALLKTYTANFLTTVIHQILHIKRVRDRIVDRVHCACCNASRFQSSFLSGRWDWKQISPAKEEERDSPRLRNRQIQNQIGVSLSYSFHGEFFSFSYDFSPLFRHSFLCAERDEQKIMIECTE